MSAKRSGSAITGSGGGSSSSSRFRLIRLPAPGETLRRGRWICRDFYEREGGARRVPVSLEAPPGLPVTPHLPHPHQPRSLGAFAQLVQQTLPSCPPSPRPALGLAGDDSDDEDGAGVSSIDTKIEQAMELVKCHVLLAVREELEQLRGRLRGLRGQRQQLELENRLLRGLATPQQLQLLSTAPSAANHAHSSAGPAPPENTPPP